MAATEQRLAASMWREQERGRFETTLYGYLSLHLRRLLYLKYFRTRYARPSLGDSLNLLRENNTAVVHLFQDGNKHPQSISSFGMMSFLAQVSRTQVFSDCAMSPEIVRDLPRGVSRLFSHIVYAIVEMCMAFANPLLTLNIAIVSYSW